MYVSTAVEIVGFVAGDPINGLQRAPWIYSTHFSLKTLLLMPGYTQGTILKRASYFVQSYLSRPRVDHGANSLHGGADSLSVDPTRCGRL